MDRLFRVIFLDNYSYANLPLLPDGYDYDSVALGPGEKTRSASPQHILALVLPWLILAWMTCTWFSFPDAAAAAGVLAIAFAAILAAQYVIGRSRGDRNPI